MVKPYPQEIIDKIRQEVLTGKSKYRVAKEMGIPFQTIYTHTMDIPNQQFHETGIQGKSLELLKMLLEEGYVHSNQETHQRLRRLKRYLPMIQRAQIDGKSIYFLDDKNKLALQSMIKTKHSKIISYQELKSISKVFGVNLDSMEKHRYVRFKDKRVFPIIRKKTGGFLSSLRKSQTQLDDFVGQSGFLGKNGSLKSRKIQQKISNFLLENDDSLVDFCIRMYCSPIVVYDNF